MALDPELSAKLTRNADGLFAAIVSRLMRSDMPGVWEIWIKGIVCSSALWCVRRLWCGDFGQQ